MKHPRSVHEGVQAAMSSDAPTGSEPEPMSEHDVSFDGTHFVYRGVRYSRLGDAPSHAWLTRERAELAGDGLAGPDASSPRGTP